MRDPIYLDFKATTSSSSGARGHDRSGQVTGAHRNPENSAARAFKKREPFFLQLSAAQPESVHDD